MNKLDIAIIGAGVAGVFCLNKLASLDASIGVFEFGRPPAKRRRQIEGWLGCLPNSDGKFYLTDKNKIENITKQSSDKLYESFLSLTDSIFNNKVNVQKNVKDSLFQTLSENKYCVEYNHYIQTIPKDSHLLSKKIVQTLDGKNNITYYFDDEVKSISKKDKGFIIENGNNKIYAKKVIFCIGRSGWKTAGDIFSALGIVSNNDYCEFGLKVEVADDLVNDFNHSTVTLKKDMVTVGPFSWDGTVIPEDHYDIAITAFRSNEPRWKSDKVSFNLIKKCYFKDKGFYQLDRLSKLMFLLCNDRAVKEKITAIDNKNSKIYLNKEFSWVWEELNELNKVIPNLIDKGYYHLPTFITLPPKINLNENFESEIDNFYVAGESAGESGLLFAALSGISIAENFINER